MPPVLTSVSPSSGPPGTAIALVGSGFTAASQVACPAIVPTTFVSSTQLTAAIPVELAGPGGGSILIAVVVYDPAAGVSGTVTFTVQFPAVPLQGYTTVDAVAGEVPGFERGGQISDDMIQRWIENAAQIVNGVMLKRGLDPTLWAQPAGDAMPDPSSVLEMIVRLGAAADLAAAVSSVWGNAKWPIVGTLSAAYDEQLQGLRDGEYDHLFLATGAVTEITGPMFAGSTPTKKDGRPRVFFKKGREF